MKETFQSHDSDSKLEKFRIGEMTKKRCLRSKRTAFDEKGLLSTLKTADSKLDSELVTGLEKHTGQFGRERSFSDPQKAHV